MTTPFRLFSLPFIPLKKVLDNFGPHGILILSLCSRRSKCIAVSYKGPSKDVQLQLMYGDSFGTLGNDSNGIWEATDVRYLFGVSEGTLSSGHFRGVPYKMDGDCLVTYWKDKLTALFEIGMYARELFNRDFYQIIIGDKDTDDYKCLVEWTMNTQGYIEHFYFKYQKTRDDDLDYILENLKCTGSLELSARPSKNYRPAKPLVFNPKDICIHKSFWIRQKDLLGMNCRSISIFDSKLSSQDLNVFLKHWMTGGCSQLKLMEVTARDSFNFESVLDGVEFTEKRRDVKRVYHIETTPYTITGGFDIKRPSDNTIATIRKGVEDRFLMFVWPDFAGNSY